MGKKQKPLWRAIQIYCKHYNDEHGDKSACVERYCMTLDECDMHPCKPSKCPCIKLLLKVASGEYE